MIFIKISCFIHIMVAIMMLFQQVSSYSFTSQFHTSITDPSTSMVEMVGNDNENSPKLHPDDSFHPNKLQYHGTTTLAFIYKDSVIVAVDSMASIGDFVGSRTVRKILPVSKNIVATMAGGAADCSHWIKRIATRCKLLEFDYGAPPRVVMVGRMLSQALRDQRQHELSVGTMVCGWDKVEGPSIYYVDSTGVMLPGKFFSVGSGSPFAYSCIDSTLDTIQKQEDVNRAVDAAIAAIRHASERDCYSGGYINVVIVNSTGCHHIKRVDARSIPVRITDWEQEANSDAATQGPS